MNATSDATLHAPPNAPVNVLLPRPRRVDLTDQTVPVAAPEIVTAPLPPQGYRITIDGGGVRVDAADDAG
ncbi:MAG: hypothetical protein ACYDD7_14170, partial [Acidimicrobiales bacterium]